MKTGLLLCCALPLSLLVACGGGEPEKSPATNPANQSAQSHAGKPDAGQSDTGKANTGTSDAGQGAKTPEPGKPAAGQQAKKQKPKRIRRPRVDMRMVKVLFGNESPAPKAEVASSPALVALGNALYHSEHLSKNGNISCASCHDLSTYGVDHKETSAGSTGENGVRNTPTTYNAHRQLMQFWDGRAATVEAQAIMPVLNPIEHGLADEAELVQKMKSQTKLVDGFKQAFPGEDDPVTAKNFGHAIGAFERTLVTTSKWDEYLDGNQRALSNLELLGLKTFMEIGCTTCHINRGLGGHMFQKAGLLKPYPGKDTGRMQVTGNVAEKFMFKVPMLLNVEKTAPYYHDGKIATLEEAVVIMADMQLARPLTQEQTDAIVAFLLATTGKLPEQFAKKK